MNWPPTLRQIEVLNVIQRHQVARGFPPTIRELGTELGINSTNGVQCHLLLLAKKGLIERIRGSARTLKLTATGRKYVAKGGA